VTIIGDNLRKTISSARPIYLTAGSTYVIKVTGQGIKPYEFKFVPKAESDEIKFPGVK